MDSLRVRGFWRTLVKSAGFPVRALFRKWERDRKLRANSISCGRLRLTCQEGCAKIYWAGAEITKDIGLNTSICVAGEWRGSSQAEWSVEKQNRRRLIVRSIWRALPVEHLWQITLIDENHIDWEIQMVVKGEVAICERKAGLMLSERYRRWVTSNEEGEFPEINGWQDIPLKNLLSRCAGVRSCGGRKDFLPAVLLDFPGTMFHTRPQVQNSDRDINARFLQARTRETVLTTKYPPGEYKYFKGQIHVIIKEEALDRYRNSSIPQKVQFFPEGAKADIALIMCPPWQTKMPPLGLAYLVSYIKSKGFEPLVVDLNVKFHNNLSSGNERIFWQIDTINHFSLEAIAEGIFNICEDEICAFVEQLLRSEIKAIGFSVNSSSSTLLAGKISEMIKARDNKKVIIFGGPGCCFDYDRETIRPELVDTYVIGEGEEALHDLLKALKEGRELPKFSTAPPARDLDSIPFPTFSEFDLDEYNKGNGYQPLPLLMSRGCIGKCSFCTDRHIAKSYRFRNPSNILDEIKYHVGYNNIRDFEFNDLLCNGNLKQLESLCDLIIESRLEIVWTSYAVIRKDMDRDLLLKMKRAGCVDLCYGMESGSDKVLKRMNKFYTAGDAERVLRSTHDAGINTRINIIVGFPGEGRREFDETIEFIRRNRDYIDQVTNLSTIVINPGADLGLDPGRFGITFLDSKDLSQFLDENKTDRRTRIERVQEMISILKDLGLFVPIINCPGGSENPGEF